MAVEPPTWARRAVGTSSGMSPTCARSAGYCANCAARSSVAGPGSWGPGRGGGLGRAAPGAASRPAAAGRRFVRGNSLAASAAAVNLTDMLLAVAADKPRLLAMQEVLRAHASDVLWEATIAQRSQICYVLVVLRRSAELLSCFVVPNFPFLLLRSTELLSCGAAELLSRWCH